MQSAKQAGLQTYLLHSSPQTITSDTKAKRTRQSQETVKTMTGIRHALLTALLHMLRRYGLVAAVGMSESTRLLKDQLDCGRIDSNKVKSVNSKWNVAHDPVDSFALSWLFA